MIITKLIFVEKCEEREFKIDGAGDDDGGGGGGGGGDGGNCSCERNKEVREVRELR